MLQKPNAVNAEAISGINKFAAPPPALPKPPAVALAVPLMFGANIIEVWNCVITNDAPITPMAKRKSKKEV
ncbi:hypothetical protein D3C73_919720 [compost metagenome]